MIKHSISSESLFSVISAEKNNNGAEFTIKSKVTGKDYTYQIGRKVFNNKWYTHIMVETQYMQYKYLGTYFNGKIYHKRRVVDSPSAIAIAFVLNQVELKNFAWLDGKIELMHLGSCLRCGRPLTDANSIQIGLGPICKGQL